MAACISHIEARLAGALAPARSLECVADVRVLGAIGVVETRRPVDVGIFQQECVRRGVWIRPFGRNVYVMPPYVTPDADLDVLCSEMIDILRNTEWK